MLQNGSLSSKTGASPLRKYTAPPSPLRSKSATQVSKTVQNAKVRACQVLLRSKPCFAPQYTRRRHVHMQLPGTFLSRAEQHKQAMKWLKSNHNSAFLPPMPRSHPNHTPKLAQFKGEKSNIVIST